MRAMTPKVSHQTTDGAFTYDGGARFRQYRQNPQAQQSQGRVTTDQTFAQVVQYIHDRGLSFGSSHVNRIFVEDRDFCMSMTFEKGLHILMVNEKTGFLDYVLEPEVEIASSGPSRFVAPN